MIECCRRPPLAGAPARVELPFINLLQLFPVRPAA